MKFAYRFILLPLLSVISLSMNAYGQSPQLACRDHSCSLLESDGTIWSWGRNTAGELGDGTFESRSLPVREATYSRWKSISTQFSHTLAIGMDDSIWAWGDNIDRQIGDESSTNRAIPTLVDGASDWKQVSAGYYHSAALKKDGTIWVWGANWGGQAGNGTEEPFNLGRPTQVGSDNDWISIHAGIAHNIALKRDGSIWGWGRNWFGTQGNGSFDNNSLTPTQIMPPSIGWKGVYVGGTFVLAWSFDGSLWGWGSNYDGQIGDGTLVNHLSPTLLSANNEFTSIATAESTALGLKPDGSLWGWGRNFEGNIGVGFSSSSEPIPVPIAEEGSWVTFSLRFQGGAAMKSDGSIWTWGDNKFGGIGNGYVGPRIPSPVATDSEIAWKKINRTLALSQDGKLYGCGTLPPNSSTLTTSQERVLLYRDDTWQDVGNGLGIKTDGTLWRLVPDPNEDSASFPLQIGIGTTWSKLVKVVDDTDCKGAIASNGALWTWSSASAFRHNFLPQCKYGTAAVSPIPAQFGTDTNWKEVTFQPFFLGYGIKTDGTLWAWGTGHQEGLGNGTMGFTTIPVQIGTDRQWKSVVSGVRHTVGLKLDGTLWAWGSNEKGAIGDNNSDTSQFSTPRLSPVQIGLGQTWMFATAGFYSGFGITTDGSLWAWGRDYFSNLGFGRSGIFGVPTRLAEPARKWANIFSTYGTSFGISASGRLYVWGDNTYNQLCVPGSLPQPSPLKINLTAAVTASINTISYGEVPLGLSEDKMFTISNISNEAVPLAFNRVATPFSITTPCTEVPAQGSCEVHITYSPTQLGRHSGAVSYRSTIPGAEGRILVVGVGIPGAPPASPSPTPSGSPTPAPPQDDCPDDPAKRAPGVCGCGVADSDSDGNGIVDCSHAQELEWRLTRLHQLAMSPTRQSVETKSVAMQEAFDQLSIYNRLHGSRISYRDTGADLPRLVVEFERDFSVFMTAYRQKQWRRVRRLGQVVRKRLLVWLSMLA